MKTPTTILFIALTTLISSISFARGAGLPGSALAEGDGSVRVHRNFTAEVSGQSVSYKAGQVLSGRVAIVKQSRSDASVVVGGQLVLVMKDAVESGYYLKEEAAIGSGLSMRKDFDTEYGTIGSPSKETKNVSCTLTDKIRTCDAAGKCQDGTIERQGIRTIEVSDDNSFERTKQKVLILNSKGQTVMTIDMGTNTEYSRSREIETMPCH